MPKLLHDATDFDLLPPGVELDKATIRGDMLYCVRVDEREEDVRPRGEGAEGRGGGVNQLRVCPVSGGVPDQEGLEDSRIQTQERIMTI